MSVNESILSLALITVELDYSRYNSMTRHELKEYLFNYINNPNNSSRHWRFSKVRSLMSANNPRPINLCPASEN